MTIFLIRHGETDWNVQMRLQGCEDIELNATGIKQANRCGKVFKQISIDAILSSPLKRAVKTSEILASYVGLEKVIIDQNLIERDFGKISGMTPDERDEFNKTGQDAGIENWDSMSKRVIDALLSYYENSAYQNIIAVSHGAAINAVLSVLSKGEIGTGKTWLKNTCVNVLHSDGNSMKIDYYNLTAEEFAKIMNIKV
jgi:uncharacterized phosphatase